MDVLQQISRLRKERGWSYYRLAKEAGIPQSTLSNLYRRENSPAINTLESICKAFGISLAQFFAETDGENTLTDDQKKLLAKWLLLTPHQKEKVMAYILGLLQQ